ncbi:hypothetical protein JCM8547_006039, partial [Rhodosporidiobolus lusitaniae]
ITRKLIMPYTPQTYGVPDGVNRTLVEGLIAVLSHASALKFSGPRRCRCSSLALELIVAQRLAFLAEERGSLPGGTSSRKGVLFRRRSRGFGWIYDLNLLAWGKTVTEAIAAAQHLVPSLKARSDSHFSAFEPSKTLATLFDPPIPCLLSFAVNRFSPSLTMLGVEIDSSLLFRTHRSSCVARASSALSGVRLLSRTNGGLRPRLVRLLDEAVVMPRLLYRAQLW